MVEAEAPAACLKTGAGALEVDLGAVGEQRGELVPRMVDLSDAALTRRLRNLLRGLEISHGF